jgi:hypothetical protein
LDYLKTEHLKSQWESLPTCPQKNEKKNSNGKSFCSGEEDIVDEKKDKEIN